MNAVDLLMHFNLTKLEAQIYITLLAEGELTGYEVAKLTGISRSNIYTALAGLADKGAAYLMEGTAARYTPVPLDEFCANSIRRMEQLKQDLLKSVPARRKAVDGYVTIKGRLQIIHKMKNMIEQAAERVYVAVPAPVLELILEDLASALKRGIKVVAITESQHAPGGATVWAAAQPPHQIRLIADSMSVLTGDIANGEDSTCLYSMKKNLIDLFKDALKNEIRLIELAKENRK